MAESTLIQTLLASAISLVSITIALIGILQVVSAFVHSSKEMREIDKLEWRERVKKDFRFLKIVTAVFTLCIFLSLVSVMVISEFLAACSIIAFVAGMLLLLWQLKNLRIEMK